MFGKPLREVTVADIVTLIDAGVCEDDELEFKRFVGADLKQPKDVYADIAKELIAFANTRGGVLIYGLTEGKSGEGASRASDITWIPDATSLKADIERTLNARLEPRLSPIDIHIVPNPEDGTQGIILLQVPRSLRAPHWDRQRRYCYVRMGEHSQEVGMSDIQDMTLSIVRDVDRVTSFFADRQREVEKLVPNWPIEGALANFVKGYSNRVVFECAAIPLRRLSVDRLNEGWDFIPPFGSIKDKGSRHEVYTGGFPGIHDWKIGLRRWQLNDPFHDENFYGLISADGSSWLRYVGHYDVRQEPDNHHADAGFDAHADNYIALWTHMMLGIERYRKLSQDYRTPFAVAAFLRAFRTTRVIFGQSQFGRGIGGDLPNNETHCFPQRQIMQREQIAPLVAEFSTNLCNACGMTRPINFEPDLEEHLDMIDQLEPLT